MALLRSALGFFRCWVFVGVLWVCLVHFGWCFGVVYGFAGVWVVELIVELRLFWAC